MSTLIASRVQSNPCRVLIVGEEHSRLFALSGHLTLNGYQVDRVRRSQDARALLDQLDYRALVAWVAGPSSADPRALELMRDLRSRGDAVRTVILADYPHPSDMPSAWQDADVILGTHLSVLHLARTLSGFLSE